MRILISTAGPLQQFYGGGQTYVQTLAVALRNRGHDVTLLAPAEDGSGTTGAGTGWQNWRFRNIPVIGVTAETLGQTGPWELRNRPFLTTLSQVLAETRPEIIHINGWKSQLSWVSNQTGVPHVVTAHHPGVVCPNGSLLRPDNSICRMPANLSVCVPCFLRQRRWGATIGRVLGAFPRGAYVPVGAWIAKVAPSNRLTRFLSYPLLVERLIEERRVAHREIRCWIAPSCAMQNALIRNGVLSDRIQLVPHGIVPLRKAPLSGLPDRPLRFGYLGTINRSKGLHVLFQAFKFVQRTVDCELHVIGAPQGPSEERYFRRVTTPGLAKGITLHGSVGRTQIEAAITQFDVLVHPAIMLEVFGLAVLEALSVGRPAIVTDCGGPAETITQNVNGLVVPPNDIHALAQAMRLLAGTPTRVLEMASRITPVRSIEQHISDLEIVFGGVVDRNLFTPRQ